MMNYLAARYAQKRDIKRTGPRRILKSDRGVALLIVLILSAVALAVMTAMISMIFSGTQISGMHKKFKTAAQASHGGLDMFKQIILMRGQSTDTTAFITNLNDNFSMNAAITTDVGCTGTNLRTVSYTGISAKLLTQSNTWTVQCKKTLTIDPTLATTYDLTMELGSSPRYAIYAKIAETVEGNSGTGASTGSGASGKARIKGVVSRRKASIPMVPIPYLYAIEIEARNIDNPAERAKISELYQY